MTPRLIFAGALLLAAAPVVAQQAPPRLTRHPESGYPLITSYAPREVGGAGQIWAVIQDARGVIYASSSVGVIEYDGASWRLIPTTTRTTVRSLALDHQGRIYVGAVGEFGYLAVDATGAKHFVSLLDRVPADERRFEDVWRIWVTPEGVYFQTQVALFRWADNVIRVWKAPARFNRSSYVRGRILLTQPGLGITEFDGETFRTLPGTERFSNEVYPIILPYDEKRSLIGTRTDGLFLYDGSTATGFPTDADDFLKNNNLYRGFELPDGSIALTTTGAGMGIFNREGRLLETVNRGVGLADDSVYYVFPDREGALWLGLASGLARVETPSPASTFDENAGLRTAVQQAIRHRGTLYVATAQGVQYLRPAVGSDGPRFVPVSGMPNQTWWLLPFIDPVEKRPTQLLVAGSNGLYRIDGDTATPIRESVGGNYNAAALLQSAVTPNRVYVGLFDGLASYRWSGHQWVDEGRISNVSEQMRSFAETTDGRLWVGTQTSGVTRLRLDDRGVSPTERPPATVEEFGDADGLEGGVFVRKIGDEVYFLTRDKIFRFNESGRRFVLADDFMRAVGFNELGGGFGVEGAPDGRAYVNVGRETAVGTKGADGSYSFDKRPFARFAEMGAVFSLYAEPDGVLWMTLPPATLVRYDNRVPPRPTAGFSALIRKVTVNQDTVIAGGDNADSAPPRLASSNQALRVEFAAPTFGGESGIEYQSILEGLDDNWSDWSREPRRDYTNLGLGDYQFKVRARNQAGDVSQEAVYAFTILPPWYRTWAAYAGYLLLIGVALFAVDHVMRRRVVGKERERAQFAEAKYRAEAAEALAHSESERKRNVELISEIGREITASLDFETIFGRLYERVNQLADADVFGVGLFHPDKKEIEYRLAIERGTRYAPYTRDATDPNQFPVWCLEHKQPVFINDVEHEYSRYIGALDAQSRRLEDGTMSRAPQSLIYLPLTAKDRVLGIITIQSFEKHAYTDHHLNVVQSLAAFASIALDNADAYRQLNDQEHEIRRLFEEAERARSAAEEADAAKSAFLSTVSHELRTPLTSVLGFAKIIKKRLEERLFPLIQTDDRKVRQTMQQVQENLQVVVGEGERLTKLIDDVLDLAKIEAGKLEWHMDNVVLSELIDHATAATASLLDHKGLQLVKEVPANLPVVIGDRDRLIQVVINLISNAVKFTEAGSVTCRAERRDDEIVISVTDTGLGIAPADQPKVFERFKQVGDTLTDKPKGTGLGLPISREIVEHHGGRIWVTSEPGRGSTFAFSLPVGKDARATTPVDLAAIVRQLREHVVVSTPRMTTERAPRILVVDDEQNIRDLLTQEFVEAGYQVTAAANGRDAIQEVRHQRPDLIVLDVMMPEMNGFDVAAVLKNDPHTADIPIVILSIVQDRERGFRLGVDRYLTKPIDTDLLFKEVGELITQKKSHRRVLIVDDDAPTVKALSDVLKGRGYSVTETRDADLFETAKTLQPDVIMLNSVSPRPDVVQMLRFEKGLENVLFLVYQ